VLHFVSGKRKGNNMPLLMGKKIKFHKNSTPLTIVPSQEVVIEQQKSSSISNQPDSGVSGNYKAGAGLAAMDFFVTPLF